MPDRFGRRGGKIDVFKSVIFPMILFLLIIVLLNAGLGALSGTTAEEQLESARNAVTKAAVQCYAIEGRYPPGVAYMQDHYGLSVDTDKYLIHYMVFGSNIMPDIDVIPLDGSGGLAGDLQAFDGQDLFAFE